MKFAKFTRFSVFAMVLMLVTCLVAGCGGGDKKQEAAKKYLNIATGGTAGTYYPIGGAMAEVLNKNIPGMNASAQSTGASAANINMLKDGSVDLAIVQNDITYYAMNGTEMFKGKKVDGLQGIATLYPETCQIVTLEKTGIKSVSDFKGKRIAIGAAGSGVEANARQIMEAYGITYNDIKVQYLSFAEAANALKDGNVDAAFVTAGFPTAAIQDIASQHAVRMIAVDDEHADQLIKKYPFYTKTVIPANTYANFKEDTKAVAVMAMLVSSSKMDEKLGYDVTKALFTHLDRIQASHSAAKVITVKNAVQGMPIKMNAGADKFFKEQK